MTIKEGDMLVLNYGRVVNIGYIHGKLSVPYMGDCYQVTEITESGERKVLISEQRVIEGKMCYEQVIQESSSPSLIHGINNGYQDW